MGKVVEESSFTAVMPWLFLRQQAGINVEYRMAVYRYQAAAAGLLFVATLILFQRQARLKTMASGDIALVFLSLYGGTQVFLESLRDDGHMLLIFLRVAQVAAALLPLCASAVFAKRCLRLKILSRRRAVCVWLALFLSVTGLVLLEFSLDGRLAWGAPSMGRDYALMALLCGALAALPCSLCHALSRAGGKEKGLPVSAGASQEGPE